MENDLKFRTLFANEIECRVGSVSQGRGISLLLYKDARVDMRLLDEVVGSYNWERCHELINGNLFCTVTITTPDGRRVSKQDVGVESYTEKEKGQASDAFKRACFNWGIGRELYTSPFIWIPLSDEEWRDTEKKQPKVSFKVANIEYNEKREVSFLQIVDNKNKMRFSYGSSKISKENTPKPEQAQQAKPKPESKAAVDDAALSAAIMEAMKQTDVAKLEEVWNAHPEYHNTSSFISAVKTTKSYLEGKGGKK